MKLKALARKVYQYLTDMVPNIIENNQDTIFISIRAQLDSNSYDDRVAASMAMQELCSKLSEEDVAGSSTVTDVVDKLHSLIQGKYFNNKEVVVEGFISLLKMMQSILLNNAEFVNNYVQTCLKQIEKFQDQKLGYKNWIIKSLAVCLEKSEMIYENNKEKVFDLLMS